MSDAHVCDRRDNGIARNVGFPKGMFISHMENNVLICINDEQKKNFFSELLSNQNFDISFAMTGKEALDHAMRLQPNVILTEAHLPDMDGARFIREYRYWSYEPIIFIGDTMSDEELVFALDCGADDYIKYPINPSELLARLRVHIRHSKRIRTFPDPKETTFTNGDLHIDYSTCQVSIAGTPLHLTLLEYKLLCLLAKNIGKVITYETILSELWSNPIGNEILSLRVFVATLRKKLDVNGKNHKFLQTHMGIGYRMIKVEAT